VQLSVAETGSDISAGMYSITACERGFLLEYLDSPQPVIAYRFSRVLPVPGSLVAFKVSDYFACVVSHRDEEFPFAGLSVVGLFTGLIYRNKSKTDD